jgi:hypothetical protein
MEVLIIDGEYISFKEPYRSLSPGLEIRAVNERETLVVIFFGCHRKLNR